MLSCKTNFIPERSESIQIKKNLSTSMKVESPKGEYSLKQNFFDPSKNSPPNDFMKKLEMRIRIYDTYFYQNHVDKRDDSLDSE
jgi:hypothetical protein